MKKRPEKALFDQDGYLVLERLDYEAVEIMQMLAVQLARMNRRMFLPLDLLIVLLMRGHQDLAQLVSLGTEGVVAPAEVRQRLEGLAREIDEEQTEEEPKLCRANFSRGFIRILEEGWEQARHRPQAQIKEADLVRSLRWRAEAVESASIRWSIRRLSEGGGDELFDERGLLRMELFDEPCRAILRGAMTFASSKGTSFLGTPHLIAMMASIRDSILWRSADARGLKPERLREELLRLITPNPDPIPEFLIGRKTLTPRVIRIFQRSITHKKGAPLSEEALVEAFLTDGGSSLELVQALGLESEIRRALGEPRVLAGAAPVEAAIEFVARRAESPMLDMLGRDLTQEALEGRLPEIVGREKELQLVFNVLMRREQRNPLLTGEAGVGKTALAAALAQKIASGKGPERLRGYRVIELNGASLVGGTTYRGDLEARIKSLLEEASEKVILFIDEAHAVFAPRSGSNTPAEIPNHFKSALATGKIAVMGATTADEYHRWIEQDPALKRRFERIEIEEPSPEHVRHILQRLTPELETEYGVQVAEEAIESAIELSVRFLPEQRLPDKAKKLLMDACIAQINPLAKAAMADRGEQAPETGDFQVPLVERGAVARQLHLKTSIPLERLLRGEIPWWVGLEERLRESMAGQEEAMAQMAEVLVAGRLRNSDRSRPLAALAFIGPSGVGKARAARALAKEIFYDERALISLDMSDFQEAHALSRLIGSPPGYVGYEDADMLVTPLRRRPSSVVLLEGFDRAHPRIQDRMLRLIEEGELVDTRGHRADATNAIFILTINAAHHRGGGPIGFGANKGKKSEEELDDRSLFDRVSTRVDGVIRFRELSEGPDGASQRLLESLLSRFVESLAREYDVAVELSEELRAQLLERAKEAHRSEEVERLIDRTLVTPVAKALLGGKGQGATLFLGWDEEGQIAAVNEEVALPQ